MATEPDAVEPVLRELDQGVLLLTLNRPARNNGWTLGMENAYFDALAEGAADPKVRVVVVTGAGRSFCPGIDMEVLSAAVGGTHLPTEDRRPMTFARTVPKPVIAAINGACAGIGFIQACAADIRFAARGAKLTTAFARRGLPAENSISWLLPRLVGAGRAADLLLSSRVILAEEAHAMGLVDHLSEPGQLMADAMAYARDMALNCSPHSMAAIKQQLVADWERPAESSRLAAMQLVHELQEEDDFSEGVRSFTDRRPPSYEGLSIDLGAPPHAP
ncbi:enoyl-CoA hydratase/isomerase family protein [Acidiferrimicrobium sp. IK]|uniref:enoyl-CoA hydratase-related protein n=1 Tax=Acidiferrimicrobium sp. IK TaxID=2871700 RepID=UPI0021CB72FA|nr:enoyl-CoA hydratase-related protein [Acidiferrimicrobium sp. IK]MCU4183461.1 enoyl-CoA hydratase/isomerase family protein [Acidiferrimicrobium sp. IK]